VTEKGTVMKKNIAILYGGKSGEHEVSCTSAKSVVNNIDTNKYDVLLIGIAKNGTWFLQDEIDTVNVSSLKIKTELDHQVVMIPGAGKDCFMLNDGTSLSVDVVFPVLHGTYGEDGAVQGLLEMADIPYVGCDVLGSSINMDKDIAKILWRNAGIPVVPHVLVRTIDWEKSDKKMPLIEQAERDFRYPLFVKPSRAGSSVGAGVANDRAELETRIADALAWDNKVLIEPFIPAREIECSVTGNGKLEAYTPGEIVPSHEFYDYDAKYTDPNGAKLLIPANLDETELRKIRELAIRAAKATEINGLSRIDFFVRKDTGEIFLNEANTLPGFTTISMFPKMCEASGLSYSALLDHLLTLAEERYTEVQSRRFSRE
jgi:D-alanine-D-alanine ligase